MIVLDTNVLSEVVRDAPSPAVLEWMRSVDETTAVTSVSIAELSYGIRRLPRGARRDGLIDAVETALARHPALVLDFDERAARTYGFLRSEREAIGRPISVEDAMIAAICSCRGASLATRNTADFSDLGLHLIDPWSASPSLDG
ncbi:type II toxin-antitoxin system VapC family toxin [Cnuibacter sp. UC19_7]|uniref:type II toxin-antitoxin system VapC family toxin n=1 Tax=Cnuibacter sp. UC19_7 TaxID=3350166 RepID=UPI00366FAAD8